MSFYLMLGLLCIQYPTKLNRSMHRATCDRCGVHDALGLLDFDVPLFTN
jgi:hypothetical protein